MRCVCVCVCVRGRGERSLKQVQRPREGPRRVSNVPHKRGQVTETFSGSEAGSYSRLIDFCIIQL